MTCCCGDNLKDPELLIAKSPINQLSFSEILLLKARLPMDNRLATRDGAGRQGRLDGGRRVGRMDGCMFT